MNAGQTFVTFVAVAAILTAPCLAEDRECRWFIPATGLTVPVHCDEAETPPQQVVVQRPLLGLTLAALTQGLRNDYGIENGVSGVIIIQVDSTSDAAVRGIARGDVILESNEATVSTPEDVVRSIDRATKDGRKALVLHLSNSGGGSEYVTLPL
jgi:serine protease Do